MNIVTLLQWISATLLLLNKIYVYQKKPIGWVYGMFGTIVVSIYFYLQMIWQGKSNLWIMIVYDTALFFIMLYGLLVIKQVISKKWELMFKSVIVILTLSISFFILYKATKVDAALAVQFTTACIGLLGTMFLAFNKRKTNMTGWVLYFFAHVTCIYLFAITTSPILALGQAISAGISVMGYFKEKKAPDAK